MKKRQIALMTAAATILSSVCLAADAANAEVLIFDGERTALISSFGRINYNGENYVTFKNLPDALAALGDEGGNIYFTGSIKWDDALSTGSSPIRFKGIDKKASSAVIDATEKGSLRLSRDVTMENCVLKTDAEAGIFTGNHAFSAGTGFDAYLEKYFISEGNKGESYPAPLIVSAGESTVGHTKNSTLSAGTYKALAGGAYGAVSVAANTAFTVTGGEYEGIYAGNFGEGGSFSGSSDITIAGGHVKTARLGSEGGTTEANLFFTIKDGTKIDKLLLGSEGSANENFVLRYVGGEIAAVETSGKTVGRRILITREMTDKLPAELFDTVIVTKDTTVRPVFSGTTLSGFEMRDENGFSPCAVYANGNLLTGQNGLYALPEGTVTVTSESASPITVQKDIAYMAGYTDGSFGPQKNLSRAEAITLLSRLVCADISALSAIVRNDYDDVAGDAWYSATIGFFETLGYLDALEQNGNILPNAPITRGEFSILARQILSEIYNGREFGIKTFPDVAQSSPYFDAVGQLGYLGVIGGYPDGTFRPDGLITRAEVATIVNRMLSRIPTGEAGDSSFTDIEGHWAKAQILAASSGALSSDGRTVWTSGGDLANGSFTFDENAGVSDKIRALVAAAKEGRDSKDILSGIDSAAEKQIEKIHNSPSEYPTGGTVYYVSPDGDNENDGLTPETAWRNLAKLNKKETNDLLKEGDAVLFRRGGMWRGVLPTVSGVTYSAYGEGAKPIFNGSKRNYADKRYWLKTDTANVYECALSPDNTGVIVFDDKGVCAYDNKTGRMKIVGKDGFTGKSDLKYDLEFYSDLVSGTLYLYSENGNPGERFSSIEIGSDLGMVHIPSSGNVTLDNLSFRFGGAHGVAIGGKKNVTVQNCTFDYIGGAILKGFYGTNTTRYGNALQVFGSCDGWTVRNNHIVGIYDTGITHQYNSSYEKKTATMDNVEYTGNVIEYCHWSIEYYNPDYADTVHYMKNIRISDNICRMNGYGWGSVGRESGSSCIESFGAPTSVENFLFENNIFDRSAGKLFDLPGQNDKKVSFRGNLFVQNFGGTLGTLYGNKQISDDAGVAKTDSAFGQNQNAFLFNNDKTQKS